MKKRKSFTDILSVKNAYQKRLDKLLSRNIKSIFSQRFKEQKKKAGLSNSQLADILCVSDSTIDKWLGGSSMPKNIEELLKVCALFDKPVRYFIGEIDIAVSEIAQTSGLVGLDSTVFHNLIELAAFLDSFAGNSFSDYYFTVNKLFSSKQLLRAIFEYIIVSNNHTMACDVRIDSGNNEKHWINADNPIKIDNFIVDRDFLKRIGLEKIKVALDNIASEKSVYDSISVIDISNLYDGKENKTVINAPFPFE